MAKECVFCGKPPQSKSKEHIFPQWLIKLTGDPKRPFNFAVMHDDKVIPKSFAFDRVTLPACSSCNYSHAALEEQAKEAVQALLDEEPLTDKQVGTLLDWMDKIRIGAWTFQLTMSGTPVQTRQKFHIAQRIGQKDRYLKICRINQARKSLAITGTFFPSFQLFPSLFGLRINSLILLNASYDFMLSEPLGYARVTHLSHRDDGSHHSQIDLTDLDPTNSLFLDAAIQLDGTELCQPLHGAKLLVDEDGEAIQEHEMVDDPPIGQIFERINGEFRVYDRTDTKKIIRLSEPHADLFHKMEVTSGQALLLKEAYRVNLLQAASAGFVNSSLKMLNQFLNDLVANAETQLGFPLDPTKFTHNPIEPRE